MEEMWEGENCRTYQRASLQLCCWLERSKGRSKHPIAVLILPWGGGVIILFWWIKFMPWSTNNKHTTTTIFGAAIRFHLQWLLNPVPLTATNTEPTKFPQTITDYSICHSRVHRLVQMVAGCDDHDSAVADGSISSVFYSAIQYIYSYFDFSCNKIVSPKTTLAKSRSINAIKIYGLTNSVGIRKTSSYHVFPAQFDARPVVHSVMKLQNVLATGKACTFIVYLLDCPVVLEAINDVGGWVPVEKLSALLSKHQLDKICPEYAHFQILNDMNLF